ncbi:dihydroneopterin aldolase [Planktothricoides raciborskii]|nr:dihydroneopterin aldolase [Planktothricoides raciborskii]
MEQNQASFGKKMDAIEITGLRYYGYVGYFPEEQVLGQWFEVDLTLWLDLSVVGQNDRLEDTLNYADVVEQVRQLMETAKFKTVERLNTAIIEAMLNFEKVQKVRSRLVKVSPPIPGFPGHIVIEMIRDKDRVS